MRIAVDVGGTFTDVVVLDDAGGSQRQEKVETIPSDPARGVLNGFEKVDTDLGALEFFVHGTTLGINALLTRTGATVAIITTRGFRDVYELGRTDREPMYDFKYTKSPTLVPRRHVFEVDERMRATGVPATAFDRASAVEAARRVAALDVDAVAVCFLHSYASPAHELEMERVLGEVCPGLFVSLSHRLSREYREYERTSTTVIDAYVKPITSSYLDSLETRLGAGGFHGHFLLTRSGGGAMTVAAAKEQPVHLVLSGPAGGVIGATALSRILGRDNLITIDMGGTSLDASLIAAGQPKVDSTQTFEGLPVSIPAIDIHTIGAGGGSIAWVDDGGHLQVGPQSAGADPGPAFYAKGGEDATFSDAALAVGYMDPTNFLGGEMEIDRSLTQAAVERLARQIGLPAEITAAGILRIGTARIAGAVRVISVERGYDPREFSILAYGGAGPFVATRVARELMIPTVIVPPGPSTFSAFGMLMADVVSDFSQTRVIPLDVSISTLNDLFEELHSRAAESLSSDGIAQDSWRFLPSVEMRYAGQEHAINVPIPSHRIESGDVSTIHGRFSELHLQNYGHAMDDPVEIVTVRLRAVGLLPQPELPQVSSTDAETEASPVGQRHVFDGELETHVTYMVYDRQQLRANETLSGPAIVEEPTATTVLHDGDKLTVGAYGEMIIRVALAQKGQERT